MKKILLVLVLLATLFLLSCVSPPPRGLEPPLFLPDRPSAELVIYDITGSATYVDVTLNNATGGTEQYNDVLVPHSYTYGNFTDNFLYISAQNQGEYGTVTVSIYIHGKLFKTSTSSGAYVIATASGIRE